MLSGPALRALLLGHVLPFGGFISSFFFNGAILLFHGVSYLMAPYGDVSMCRWASWFRRTPMGPE